MRLLKKMMQINNKVGNPFKINNKMSGRNPRVFNKVERLLSLKVENNLRKKVNNRGNNLNHWVFMLLVENNHNRVYNKNNHVHKIRLEKVMVRYYFSTRVKI